MRILLLLPFSLLAATKSFCQLEVSSGYAVNKALADGAPLHIAYDFKLANRAYTKTQIGYKYLHHFDDFVEAKLRTVSFELHQTFSYEVVKKRKYILKPNVGLHYKRYDWEAVMVPPLNTLPVRAMVMSIGEDKTLVLVSTSEGYYESYKTGSAGFSVQLQNQLLIKERLWLHITPFLETAFDWSQNTGGCYVGVIFK
ncbi:MAG: hypothetical protein ACO1NX_04300 [Chitinophagaceae bacterium]